MASVDLTIVNNSGHTVGIRLDDEQDAERIAYFKTLVKREDLDSVNVSPSSDKAPAKKAASKPADKA